MQDRKLVFCIALSILIILPAIATSTAFIHPDGSQDSYFEIFGPRIDKLVIKKYASFDAEMTALQNGEIDITDSPLTAEWIDTFASDSNIVIADYGGENGYYTINFNHNNNTYLGNPPDPIFPNPVSPNPMSELALRQACAYFINRTALTEDVGQGLYDPIYTPIPAYLTYWIHPEIKLKGTLENLTYPFDQTYAISATLLDNGGFPMGPDGWRYWDMNRNGIKDSGEDFTLRIYPRADALREGATEMLETGFANPSIRIHNQRISVMIYPNPMISKNYHILLGGWIYIGPDPDYLWDLYHWDNYYHDGISNPPNYGSISIDDPTMQQQLQTIKWGLDNESILSSCQAFQKRFAETASEIPLASASAPKAYNKVYTGGNDGATVDLDDGENRYRGHSWEDIVNEAGKGENSWFTTLNTYPQGCPYGDGKMTMRYGWQQTDMPQKLNPLFTSGWAWDDEVIGRMFDTLGTRDPMTKGPTEIPRLVENWTTGIWTDPSDGREKSSVTLTIRPGIFWSDGEPFTIEDVIYNIYELPKELGNKVPPIWWMPWYYDIAACYRLDQNSAYVLLDNRYTPMSASNEILLWLIFYCAKGTPWIVPKHLWRPFIAAHEEAEITSDLSVTHPEMLVGTGPFVFVENTQSTLILARNPFYYQTMDKAVLRYNHFGANKIVEGITVTALPPSTQIRPYKVKPDSWGGTGDARLTIPITNLDVDDSSVINEKIELVKPDGSVQVLLDSHGTLLTPLQVSLQTFDMHDLEKGEHTLKVTIEVTGGQLYDYVTTNLPIELRSSILGPRTLEKSFWITTLGDTNEDGVVDIFDMAIVAVCFGSRLGELNFNPEADVLLDHTIDIFDIVKIALDYGWTY